MKRAVCTYKGQGWAHPLNVNGKAIHDGDRRCYVSGQNAIMDSSPPDFDTDVDQVNTAMPMRDTRCGRLPPHISNDLSWGCGSWRTQLRRLS